MVAASEAPAPAVEVVAMIDVLMAVQAFDQTINKQPARHEIEELLPWYATGTLNGRDTERVEQAIAGDGELAHRYELVRGELAEITRLNEALGVPSARAKLRANTMGLLITRG